MSHPSRPLAAAIVAPLAPAVVFSVFGLGAALVAGIFSYIVFVALGLPAISVLRRFGKLNIFSLLLSGAVIGAGSFLCFSLLFAKLLGSTQIGVELSTFAWGAGLGALVAGSFGVIAGVRNLRTPQASHSA